MKISVTANNHTELSFPSLNIDLSLFFLINTQLRVGKLYINGWPAKQEKASQKGAVYHQVWQWSRLHDQLFKRKSMFPYFLHLRKRLYNATLRAYTEELEAFWPLFFPWSSRIVSRANIDRKETVKSMQVFLIFVRLRSTEASFQSAVVCSRINIVQQMLRN